MTLKIKPLYDRVVVLREADELKTPGGIVIPDHAAEKSSKGKVVAVGEGKVLDNGSVRAMRISVGDLICFGKYAGTDLTIDGLQYTVMKEEDVIAVLKN